MRLFLSSYRAGEYNNDLKKFAGKFKKVGVITNAKDYKTPQDRKEKVADSFEWWRSLGLKPQEIDLRPYFYKSGAGKALNNFDFVWLSGGNVFLLRRALKYSGGDKYLGDKVRRNELLLGGESAGAIIMGPTLKYSDQDYDEDSPNYLPEGYDKEIIWDGLDLISYVPVPHYQSADVGSGVDQYITKLESKNIPYKTMTDRQAIIVSGFKEKFLA